MYHHLRDMIVIPEGFNLPQPCCIDSYMLMPWEALNLHHPTTALCMRGAERKWWRLSEEEAQVGTETDFRAYG